MGSHSLNQRITDFIAAAVFLDKSPVLLALVLFLGGNTPLFIKRHAASPLASTWRKTTVHPNASIT
ncbi:hypothetical protein BQ8794_320031 [Mesorhizobium prunaredense]|uniref:Uncharacterized protein n=1 Tax=Mesorhizobium prunaredense TaxID=1631249 RepID=A0A1R3VBF8_9HYPH|nr:hypothetical protein BQ8794_320031 [Mesorhizobium prunaredense]